VTDAADFTFSLSEDGFNDLLQPIRKALSSKLASSGIKQWNTLTAKYDIACHLEGGAVDFEGPADVAPNGSFFLRELHAVWDKLDFEAGLDLDTFEVGGNCVAHYPDFLGGGCMFTMPEVKFWDKDVDVGIKLPLGGIGLVSELSVRAGIEVESVGSGENEKWGVFVRLIAADVIPISLPDTATGIAQHAIDKAVADAFSLLPDWVVDFLTSVTDWITDKVRNALDLPDDLNLWVTDFLNTSLNLGDVLITLFGDKLLKTRPILKVSTEFTLKKSEKALLTKFAGYGPDDAEDTPPPPLPDPEDKGKAVLSAVTVPVQLPSQRFTDERFILEVNLDI
jgi:hypothetical protein